MSATVVGTGISNKGEYAMRVCEYFEVILTDTLMNRISLAKFETEQAAHEFIEDRPKNPLKDLSIQHGSILIYRDLVEYKSNKLEEIKQQALAKLDPLERKALGLD